MSTIYEGHFSSDYVKQSAPITPLNERSVIPLFGADMMYVIASGMWNVSDYIPTVTSSNYYGKLKMPDVCNKYAF